jgi:hypothetical protein
MVFRNGKYTLYRTGLDLRVAGRIKPATEPIMADYLQGLIDTFQAQPIDMSADPIDRKQLEDLQGLGYTQ